MEELVEHLKDIGLNSYEAKVYLALLKKYPATGYEVSKLADIPQARAYDTLKSLELAHIVTASSSKPVAYTPIRPKELTKRYRRKFTSTLDFLDKKLPDVKENYTEPILSINGLSSARTKLTELIKGATKEIFIEIWAQDFKYFEADLLDAYNRGLDIKIVGYGDFNSNFGTVFKHANGREIENSVGGRLVYVAVDNSEGLFGTLEPVTRHKDASLVWTKNKDIVFLIKEFIVHDMYLIDIGEKFPEQLKYFYGAGLKRLKDKILAGSDFYKVH